MTDVALPAAYRALIESNRVSCRTRRVLLARMEPVAEPSALEAVQMVALRAVLARVVPQAGEPIDLAARIVAGLAAGAGDGWRAASMPPDLEAYRAGLTGLDRAAQARGVPGFAQLPGAMQDELLTEAGSGRLAAPVLTAAQMQVWFEDLRGDAARAYVSHPRTMARMGYSGIGYGGDGERLPGFVRLGVGEREEWEPASEPAR